MDSSVNKISSREVDWSTGYYPSAQEIVLDHDAYILFLYSTTSTPSFTINGVEVIIYEYNSGSGSNIAFFSGYVPKGATVRFGYLAKANAKIFKLK